MLEVVKNVALFLVSMPIEVLFIVMGVCFTKQIKEKRILFFTLLLISATVSMLILRWQLWYYLAFLASGYIIMRALYKSHISDLFVFSIFYAWVAITSYIGFMVFDSIVLGYILQRTLMFGIFIFRGKFNGWYKIYRQLWNRRDDKRIKSITLRNISLIFINAFIVFLNFILIFLSNIFPQ